MTIFSNSISRLSWLLAVLLLLAAWGLILNDLTTDSFWSDEAYSAWSVRDDNLRIPQTAREAARYVRDSIVTVFDNIRADVHPPLYYLLLDAWALVTGNSDFTLRYLSALCGPLALAALYATAKRWFDAPTALIATLFLATSGFFLYYTREVRMYSLYLALSVIATWTYTRWWHRPTLLRSVLYGISAALLLYTHYTSITVIAAHGLHALFTLRQWRSTAWHTIFLFGIPLALFLPWLPFFQTQFALNTGFAAPGALPSDISTLAALWMLLTSGYGGIFVLVIILGFISLRSSINYPALSLLLLWGFAPIGTLFALNASGIAVLQMRYLMPVVPAWMLLVAYCVRHISIPFLPTMQQKRATTAIILFFTLWIAYTQASMFSDLWASKPDWRGTIAEAAEVRDPLAPTLVYLDERSPLAHYTPPFGLLDGYTVNIGWRDFTSIEIDNLANNLGAAPVQWGIVAMQAPQSWDAIAALSAERGVSYRQSVQATVFYAFDSTSDEPLRFAFAPQNSSEPLLTYTGDLFTAYTATAEESICVPLRLTVQTDIPAGYALAVHLTRGYNELVAQQDMPLPSTATDDTIEREPCLTVPQTDHYHLRLIIYQIASGERLNLLETTHYWGHYLMLGTVSPPSELNLSE